MATLSPCLVCQASHGFGTPHVRKAWGASSKAQQELVGNLLLRASRLEEEAKALLQKADGLRGRGAPKEVAKLDAKAALYLSEAEGIHSLVTLARQ